jgi:hypothetical protein
LWRFLMYVLCWAYFPLYSRLRRVFWLSSYDIAPWVTDSLSAISFCVQPFLTRQWISFRSNPPSLFCFVFSW